MSRILSRRAFVAGAITAGMAASARAQQGVSAVDVLGRTVTLPAPARKIVLAQGRQMNALGLIHSDPSAVLAGWGNDFARQSPDAYSRYLARFPALAQVPTVGDGATPNGFSFERTVALAPDLVVLNRSLAGTRYGPGDLVERFEAAGIPVAVIDFFLEPLKDTVPSLRLLGRLLGRDSETDRLIDFYEQHLARVAARLDGVQRPKVFIHTHAGGSECCASPGRGTLDDFIRAAGGTNIAAALLPGPTGQISLEQLLVSDPAIYVATGGRHLEKQGGLVLGLGVPADVASRSFARLIETPSLSALGAISGRRAFGLWHLFNDTPLHVVAIERLATWFHPERFADIDPAATLAAAARFSAIPLDGTFWVEPARP